MENTALWTHIRWGCKFSFVMGFNFQRYWEGDLYLHLKWCMDGLREEKYDWWTGLLEAIFKGWLLSQMMVRQARHGKWMISHFTVCHKDPALWYIYKYFPNCCMNFRNNHAVSVPLERLFELSFRKKGFRMSLGSLSFGGWKHHNLRWFHVYCSISSQFFNGFSGGRNTEREKTVTIFLR